MGSLYEIASTGAETSVVNSTNIIEVSQASDLPATLVADTTYVIRGTITTSSAVAVSNDGCAIIGGNRNIDKLIYTGTGAFLTVTDVNFTLRNLQLKATNGAGSIMSATNIVTSSSADNYGRTKVLVIDSCEIRNTNDVWYIQGFELVDINNVLIWYVTGSSGCQFQSNRHLEINSCEVFNWQDEPTGLTYSTAQMIELQTNTAGTGGEAGNFIGFAVLNIGGCIIHPIQTQIGLDINSGSTTAFGTIAANTFIDVGITSGNLFVPIPAPNVADGYSATECLTYDIGLNQGISNSSAYGFFNQSSGGVDTPTGGTTDWIHAEYGTIPSITNTQRFTFSNPATNRGRLTYDGTKNIFTIITISILWNDASGGDDDYNFGILKNTGTTPESGSIVGPTIAQGGNTKGLMISYPINLVTGDYFELACQNIGGAVGDDVEIFSIQFLIKE